MPDLGPTERICPLCNDVYIHSAKNDVDHWATCPNIPRDKHRLALETYIEARKLIATEESKGWMPAKELASVICDMAMHHQGLKDSFGGYKPYAVDTKSETSAAIRNAIRGILEMFKFETIALLAIVDFAMSLRDDFGDHQEEDSEMDGDTDRERERRQGTTRTDAWSFGSPPTTAAPESIPEVAHSASSTPSSPVDTPQAQREDGEDPMVESTGQAALPSKWLGERTSIDPTLGHWTLEEEDFLVQLYHDTPLLMWSQRFEKYKEHARQQEGWRLRRTSGIQSQYNRLRRRIRAILARKTSQQLSVQQPNPATSHASEAQKENTARQSREMSALYWRREEDELLIRLRNEYPEEQWCWMAEKYMEHARQQQGWLTRSERAIQLRYHRIKASSAGSDTNTQNPRRPVQSVSPTDSKLGQSTASSPTVQTQPQESSTDQSPPWSEAEEDYLILVYSSTAPGSSWLERYMRYSHHALEEDWVLRTLEDLQQRLAEMKSRSQWYVIQD